MKKIMRGMLICMIMITAIITNVNYIKADDSEVTYDGIKYRVNTEERWAAVCGYTGTDTDVAIPNMVGRGIIVSEIDDHAFDGCSSIRVLTMPDTIMKVGDMSFIGMDNLQAVISKTEGINIVVRENVKIVSDRSELGNIDTDNTGNNNQNSSTGGSSNTSNNAGDNKIEEAKSVDGGGIIIDSASGIIDTSTGNVTGTDNNAGITGETATDESGKNIAIQGSDNKKNDTAVKSDDNKNEVTSQQNKKSSSAKIVVSIICVVLIAGLVAGLCIYMKKKRR